MFLREMLNWLGSKHELRLSYLNQPLSDTMCPSRHIPTSQWLVIPRVSAVLTLGIWISGESLGHEVNVNYECWHFLLRPCSPQSIPFQALGRSKRLSYSVTEKKKYGFNLRFSPSDMLFSFSGYDSLT